VPLLLLLLRLLLRGFVGPIPARTQPSGRTIHDGQLKLCTNGGAGKVRASKLDR
jgi:hypothetical protein